MRRIMIFHFGRSGSTVLQYAMNSHPDILSAGEIYTYTIEIEKKEISDPQDFSRILDTRQPVTNSGRNNKVGFFELKSGNFVNRSCHVQLSDALDVLKKQIDGVIVLQRRNALRRIVSAELARMTGIYHVGVRPDPIKQGPMEKPIFPTRNLIDYATGMTGKDLLELLVKATRRETEIVNVVKNKFDDVMFLKYEDDIENGIDPAISKIFSRYEIPMQSLSVELKKTSRGLQNDIKNFDEVDAMLRGTPYSWMVH